MELISVGKHCKECKEKYKNCHSECFAYKIEKARRQIEKDAEMKVHKKSAELEEYITSKKCNHRRR